MKNNSTANTQEPVWSLESDDLSKVSYHGPNGELIEKTVPKGLLEDSIKLFDGKPRAIKRTSGGLSLCEPHQIVVYDRTVLELNNKWKPEQGVDSIVRIRVKFHELLKDKARNILSSETVLQTKTVHWSELKDPFEIKPLGQTSLADFGFGIIPISVFHMENDIAYFTETKVFERLTSTKQESMSLVTVYSMPVKAIRVLDPDNSIEGARAEENIVTIQKKGLKLIPDVLKLQNKIPLTAGKSVTCLQSCLIAMINPKDRRELEPILIQVKEKDDLLPFGVLEPR